MRCQRRFASRPSHIVNSHLNDVNLPVDERQIQTGDIVKATVTSGKKIGIHTGRVAVRSTGSFNISTAIGLIKNIHGVL
jgi:hypothetical protein